MKTSKLQSKIENWEIKRLGEVAEYINGRAFKPSEWEARGLPIIRIQNLTESSSVFNYFAGDLEEKYRVENGDVLLSWSASLGVYIWNKGSAALNQHIFKVIPEETSVTKKYLFFVLQTVIEQIQKKVHGSTMKHITKPVFERIKISVPPLEIQQEIVERLDAIRKAQELNDEQIALAEELFQSLLHRELDPTRSTSSGQEDKNWEVKRLGEVVTDLLNGFPSRPVPEDEGIPQFRPHNIGLDGSLVFEGIKFVPRKMKNVEKYFLRKDDLIFNNTNSIAQVGKTAYVDRDYEIVFSNHLTRIRVDRTKAIGYYLAVLLHYLYERKKFQSLCTPWVNQAAVQNSTLKNLKIPIPPLETQRQIIRKLQAVQDYKKSLLAQKGKLKELFESALDKSMKGELVK